MISSLRGDGLDEIRSYCAGKVPAGPWLYPEDQAADIPSRLLAAEITREKLYSRLHDELPYASAVVTESWKDLNDGSARIEQTIFVERDGQKAIVIGKGGQTIKTIGESARREMEDVFGRKIHLFVHAKVAERWGDVPSYYREIGLEFPKDQ
jgi:GTP-binding protein Era